MKSSGRRLRRDALAIFHAALKAADAGNAVRAHLAVTRNQLRSGGIRLALRDFDRIFLLAIGKAAPQMGAAVETLLGSRLSGGIVVTKHGHANVRLRRSTVHEAGHPIPDNGSVLAAESVETMLRELNARDLLIVAISGGASALLCAPVEPVSVAAKQATTDLLLRGGATINELNAVRKHLSRLKGGRAAALAYPATVVSLLLSDVIGDPLDVIGSGPTAPDESSFAEALQVLEKYSLLDRVPAVVREYLQRGLSGGVAETPKPRDPLFANVHNVIIGSSEIALRAAAAEAKALGYRPLILSSSMQGETREVARVHAEILREAVRAGHPVRPPACILAGGETTVTVKGSGKGGRNQEFALAAAIAMDGLPDAVVLSGGTDGTDGPTDAAGAIADGDSVARAARRGFEAKVHLATNDAYPFFEALGDLVKTGPTGTNVMDIHVLIAG